MEKVWVDLVHSTDGICSSATCDDVGVGGIDWLIGWARWDMNRQLRLWR